MQEYANGEGPDDMLYGYNHISQELYFLSYAPKSSARCSVLVRWLLSPIENFFLSKMRLGFNLQMVLSHIAMMRNANLIVSTCDPSGLPICLLKLVGVLKVPVIQISQEISDYVDRIPHSSWSYRIFFHFYQRLLKSADLIIALGEGSQTHIVKTFHLNPQKVACVPFGVDCEFWYPSLDVTPREYILAVGSHTRDYTLLLSALPKELQLKIVTRLPIDRNLLTNKQVDVESNYSNLELRGLYQNCRFVVTPLKEAHQPIGQSATLQAMACGKAVILTKIAGLWEPELIKHMENCYLVEPGNFGDMQSAILYLYHHPEEARRIGNNARSLVLENYTSEQFALSLTRQIEKVLDKY